MIFSRKLFVLIISLILLNCRDSSTPTSNLDFSPGPQGNITVTSPTSSENWQPGTVRTIMWNKESAINKVDVLLFRKDLKILTITQGIENASSYDWEVPADLDYSHHYRIKIVSSSPGDIGTFSDYFYIIGSQVTN